MGIVSEALENMVTENKIVTAVEQNFPGPGFREYQKEAIVECVKGVIKDDCDVVLLVAPTGSGKSLILNTVALVCNIMFGDRAFCTTPLNSLVDQIDNDELIDDAITIKGRNNYPCINDKDYGTAVDRAICQRQPDFDCDIKGDCKYYGKKREAIDHYFSVTNMSYIMSEGLADVDNESMDNMFGKREIIEVDECQSVEDYAMNYISFTVSENNVGEMVMENIDIPLGMEDDFEHMVDWVSNEVKPALNEALSKYDGYVTEGQVKEKERLSNFLARTDNFLKDAEEYDWVCEIKREVNKNGEDDIKVVFQPVTVGRFLEDLLWSRGSTVILSSATIPGGDWIDEVGLSGSNVRHISVPSTFPVENRPIYISHSEDIGKMTKGKREKNALPMIEKIIEIADHHGGERGFVHCRSYNIMKLLRRSALNNGHREWFRENGMVQDRSDREESLERWLDSDKQVFFSVAMDEGIDLDGDECRWQVLAKTLYKSMSDKRVRYRVQERGEWDWYNSHAAVQIQQAYGRAVRSPTDEAVFYILDKSAKSLINMNAELFNKWFLEAIQDMEIDPSRGV